MPHNLDAARERLSQGLPALVWQRHVADTVTPVGAALALMEEGRGDFLLESVEGGEIRGRYSLLGIDPDLVLRAEGDCAWINRDWRADRTAFTEASGNGLAALRTLLAEIAMPMPEALPRDDPYYEEDVDYALVLYAFGSEFRRLPIPGIALQVENARRSVRCWHPDRWTALTGEEVSIHDSHVVRRRAAYQVIIGQYESVSASGSWADWVPEGKVGCVFRRVVSVDALGFARLGRLELVLQTGDFLSDLS